MVDLLAQSFKILVQHIVEVVVVVVVGGCNGCGEAGGGDGFF